MQFDLFEMCGLERYVLWFSTFSSTLIILYFHVFYEKLFHLDDDHENCNGY